MPNTPQPHVYTVRQLIEALQKCVNQDAPVNVYLLDNVEGFKYEDCGRLRSWMTSSMNTAWWIST